MFHPGWLFSFFLGGDTPGCVVFLVFVLGGGGGGKGEDEILKYYKCAS